MNLLREDRTQQRNQKPADRSLGGSDRLFETDRGPSIELRLSRQTKVLTESLILAQDERWRRA
jgi:hypothetical protein